MNARELATVLAALRYWQTRAPQFGHLDSIATDGGKIEQLTNAEIEALCQRLNTEPVMETKLAAQLAECAGYIASVRTDRKSKDADTGEIWALQTMAWAKGAKEIAARSNSLLEQYDAQREGGGL